MIYLSLSERTILMQGKSKNACEEHMDMAFDDFLIENEAFPNLCEAADEKCSYCDKKAKYVLKEASEI